MARITAQYAYNIGAELGENRYLRQGAAHLGNLAEWGGKFRKETRHERTGTVITKKPRRDCQAYQSDENRESHEKINKMCIYWISWSENVAVNLNSTTMIGMTCKEEINYQLFKQNQGMGNPTVCVPGDYQDRIVQ